MGHLKKQLLWVSIAALFSLQLSAKERNQELSSDPIDLLTGYLPISYHFGLNDTTALGIHGRLKFFGYNRHTQSYGVGAGVSGKFFLTDHVFHDGWYIEPTVLSHFIVHRETQQKFWNIMPSVVGGYSWVWDNGFSLSAGLGVQFSYAFVDKAIFHDSFAWDMIGFSPTADLALGYVF